MSQKHIVIPASLVAEFEAWSKMTVKLFGKLRHQTEQKAVNKADEQAWFWSEEWQAKEKAADEDIASEEYKDSDTVEELIKELHAYV